MKFEKVLFLRFGFKWSIERKANFDRKEIKNKLIKRKRQKMTTTKKNKTIKDTLGIDTTCKNTHNRERKGNLDDKKVRQQ